MNRKKTPIGFPARELIINQRFRIRVMRRVILLNRRVSMVSVAIHTPVHTAIIRAYIDALGAVTALALILSARNGKRLTRNSSD